MSHIRVSLIVSTYNWVPALDLVLRSAIAQSRLPDEIIIADDGSGDETAQLIHSLQSNSPVPIIHAWQADEGFRAARSRNNAVAQSQGDYLIFVDGDTVLHRHFVADHLRFARPDVFSVGSRVLLRENITQQYFSQKQFNFHWWRTPADNKLNALHLPLLARIYAKRLRQPFERWIFKVRSCNMSLWREDFFAVNGFNQDFCGWGREDSEFALRLFKKGLSMQRLKCVAIQYHLHHQENDRAYLDANDEILANTLRQNGYRCENGIEQYER